MIAGLLLFLKGVPPWAWKLLGIVLVVLAVFGAGAHRQAKRDDSKIAAKQAEFDTFKATTAALGKAAQAQADKQKAADLAAKEKADAENTKTLADLRADNKRLLDGRSRSSYLPAASPGAGSPETACLNRADTESALRRFDAGVAGLIGEGDEAISGLNTGRNWVKSVGENLH